MTSPGQFTRAEIFSQPQSWSAALDVLSHRQAEIADFFTQGQYTQVLFTGCGSTYYLSLAAGALCQELTGLPARGLPASELWNYPASSYPSSGRSLSSSRTLLVAVSRSGSTTETVRACQAFKDSRRGDLLTLSCYEGEPLSQMGDLNILLPSGMEQSVAQTRAFSTLYLAATALSALWSGQPPLFEHLNRLPATGESLLANYQDLARDLGRDTRLERFYFLGSGPRYGFAAELSLKMKEMSLSHSEPFHFMEFRHGPKSMVNENTLLFGLASECNSASESLVLDEMRGLRGSVLAIGEQAGDVLLHSQVPEALRNVLYLPVGQLMAFERSLAKGLDPDRPHNLTAVIML